MFITVDIDQFLIITEITDSIFGDIHKKLGGGCSYLIKEIFNMVQVRNIDFKVITKGIFKYGYTFIAQNHNVCFWNNLVNLNVITNISFFSYESVNDRIYIRKNIKPYWS